MNTTKTTPKDFFLHLATTVFLYASVIALINLAFAVADRALPDALQSFYGVSDIVWPISMLVVLVPVTYILEWLIARDIAKMPEKREVWIRRWRIYLTLFLSGATIVGDLIALINTYLSGEITARFIWKILAILVICGVIFAYYLLSRLNEAGQGKKASTILAWAGVIIVLAGVIGGFIITGSPWTQRSLRFDSQRVSDLTNIQWQIISVWQQKGILPASLAVLNDPISGYSVPVDPNTGAAYEYTMKGATTFELCATFDLPTQDLSGRGAYQGDTSVGVTYPSVYNGTNGTADNWSHQAGRTCFGRTIDPSRYPVNTLPTPAPKGI